MDKTSIILTALGGMILLLGLYSRRLESSPFPPTLIALATGIVLGPGVTGVIDLTTIGYGPKILENTARLTLAIGLVGVALSIPKSFLRRNWRELAMLLGLGMPMMWLISTGLLMLILHMRFWPAALIGAILAPTDPVASRAIIAGPVARKAIPGSMRQAISFESGANDGLGYPFVLLAFMMMTRPPGAAWSEWLVKTVLLDVGMATLIGMLIGYAAARLLLWAESRTLVTRAWRSAYVIALALLAVGVGRLVRSDEVLLVFAAGMVFADCLGEKEIAAFSRTQETVDRFFSVPIFALLGIAIPWHGWQLLGWRGVLLAVAILLLRRPPVMLLLRPLLRSFPGNREALFAGWFGPVAVAAIYYAGFMAQKIDDPRLWPVVSLIIVASAVAHGASAVPLTRLYGRLRARQET